MSPAQWEDVLCACGRVHDRPKGTTTYCTCGETILADKVSK